MPFEIECHYLQLGNYRDHDVQLDLTTESRIEPDWYDRGQTEAFWAFPIIEIQDTTYQQRLINILEEVSNELVHDWLSSPVCLLLPQIGKLENQHHLQLFNHIAQVIPEISKHPNCYLYPYGRSSLLFAWKQVELLLFEQKHSEVWILAVDSDPRLFNPSLFSERESPKEKPESIAAECVILARVRASESGLSRSWFSYEVRTRDQEPSVAIEAIFRRYRQVKDLPIYQFYAPFNGSDMLVEEWTNAYYQLSPTVGKQTQVVMTSPLTGELGACSGLYNLLHLSSRYLRGEYLYNSMQLEISERLYRGAALYTWQY